MREKDHGKKDGNKHETGRGNRLTVRQEVKEWRRKDEKQEPARER